MPSEMILEGLYKSESQNSSEDQTVFPLEGSRKLFETEESALSRQAYRQFLPFFLII